MKFKFNVGKFYLRIVSKQKSKYAEGEDGNVLLGSALPRVVLAAVRVVRKT